MSEVTITAAELRKGGVIRLGGYPLTVAADQLRTVFAEVAS